MHPLLLDTYFVFGTTSLLKMYTLNFNVIADIFVGYESTVYITSENLGQVEICAVLMAPGPAIALRDFVLSSTTASGTASMSNSTPYILVGNMQLPFSL